MKSSERSNSKIKNELLLNPDKLKQKAKTAINSKRTSRDVNKMLINIESNKLLSPKDKLVSNSNHTKPNKSFSNKWSLSSIKSRSLSHRCKQSNLLANYL